MMFVRKVHWTKSSKEGAYTLVKTFLDPETLEVELRVYDPLVRRAILWMTTSDSPFTLLSIWYF